MAVIVENADSQEYVYPNIVRTETASFLEAGYCESGTNLAQKLAVSTSFSLVFKISMLENQLFLAAATTGTYLGKLMQSHLSTM